MQRDWTRRGFLGAASTAIVAGSSPAVGAGEPSAPAGPPLKILGIATSLRKGKTTAAAMQVCLDAAKAVSPRIEVELIELAGMRIDASVAAGIDLPAGQVDDFLPLVPKLTDPRLGGIIIGSPVYFGSMSSLCKAFLERCSILRKDYAWSNKVAGTLAVGSARNGGQELTIQCIQAALLCHEMLLVGDGRPTSHRGATLWNMSKEEGIAKDEWGLTTAKDLGRRVAEVALRVAAAPAG